MVKRILTPEEKCKLIILLEFAGFYVDESLKKLEEDARYPYIAWEIDRKVDNCVFASNHMCSRFKSLSSSVEIITLEELQEKLKEYITHEIREKGRNDAQF